MSWGKCPTLGTVSVASVRTTKTNMSTKMSVFLQPLMKLLILRNKTVTFKM